MALASEKGLLTSPAGTASGITLAESWLMTFESAKGFSVSKFNPRPPRKWSLPRDWDRRGLLLPGALLLLDPRRCCLSSMFKRVRKSGWDPLLLGCAALDILVYVSLLGCPLLEWFRSFQFRLPSSVSRPHQSTNRPFVVIASWLATPALKDERLAGVSGGPNCEFPRFRLTLGFGLRVTRLLTRPRNLW